MMANRQLQGLWLAALLALAGCQTAPVQAPSVPAAPVPATPVPATPVQATPTIEAPASPIRWNGQDRIELALTLDRGRRPLVPVRVMGRDTTALLDSGAGIPALSRALVADAGGSNVKIAVNGQQVDAVKDVPLELGAMSMTLPMAILIDHNAERPFVIGAELFLHAVVEMDFGTGRLVLVRPETFTPPAGEPLPVKLWNAVPTLQLQVNGNERQVCAVIDTGFNGGLALAPELVSALGLPPDPAGGTRVAQDGFGNRYDRPLLAPLQEMRFGQLVYNNVPVTYGLPLPEASACGNVLGMAVLQRHHIIFDVGHGRVWFLLR